MKNTMEKLKQEARNSWTGQNGEERANKLEAYLNKKLAEYSLALNIPQEDILDAWERNRTYSAINYYQEANQPEIKSEKVRIFETAADLFRVVKSKQFRCPACKGISTSPYKCDSGIRKNNKSCDWNVDGLFGDLGEGIHVFCKDKMLGNTIFMPLSWENEI